MKTINFFKVIIIILVLVNIGSLSFLWWGNKRPERMEDRGRGPGEYLIHELALNGQQIDQYDVMRNRHHEQMMELKARAATFRERIITCLKTIPTDSLLVRQMADSIGDCQKNAELVTFCHFQDLRKICTPKQQEKFDEVIYQAIRMLAHPE